MVTAGVSRQADRQGCERQVFHTSEPAAILRSRTRPDPETWPGPGTRRLDQSL
jgi:hypothetical protein